MINYSFIIPHHNNPELLYRLLESIPQRNDIEVIVVDDNSDYDKKPNIFRKDVKLISLGAEDSKGAGRARNVGMDHATGKWLVFADSDDKYLDDAISTLDKYKDSEAEIVFWGAVMCNYDDTTLDLEKRNWLDVIMEKFQNSEKTLKDIHHMAMCAAFPWNKMISRDFVLKIGARFDEVPIHNDTWFSRYIGSMASKIDFTKDKIYCYYRYSSNTTNRKRPIGHYYTMIKTNIRINKLLKENDFVEIALFPGFNPKYAIRDIGYFKLVELCLYELLSSPVSIIVIWNKLWRRLMRILHGCGYRSDK